MRKMKQVLVILIALIVGAFSNEVATTELPKEVYVCNSAQPEFLGIYRRTANHNDDAPIYTNDNEMSFFRNKEFWYLGNIG